MKPLTSKNTLTASNINTKKQLNNSSFFNINYPKQKEDVKNQEIVGFNSSFFDITLPKAKRGLKNQEIVKKKSICVLS